MVKQISTCFLKYKSTRKQTLKQIQKIKSILILYCKSESNLVKIILSI